VRALRSALTFGTLSKENSVNKVTWDLAVLFGTDMKSALKIQERMELSGVDFSDCSPREFNRAAREAAKELGFNFETIKVRS
jgi:hypothetical protein